MAAYAILVALTHAGEREIISGPEVPFAEQREQFTGFMAERVHDTFAAVDFLDSRRGVKKRTKFITPGEEERRAAEIERQEQEYAEAQAAAAEGEKPKRGRKPKADPPKVDPPKVDPPKVDPPKVDPPSPPSSEGSTPPPEAAGSGQDTSSPPDPAPTRPVLDPSQI